MKKQGSAEPSTLRLIASGVVTINLAQKMPKYKVYSTNRALARDAEKIVKDAKRAYGAVTDREFA
jgi:hypothetical protein